MPKIQITLEKNETINDVENMLFKALSAQASGEIHEEDTFTDPAMQDLIKKIELEHENMFKEMVGEIFEELDEEYSNGYI